MTTALLRGLTLSLTLHAALLAFAAGRPALPLPEREAPASPRRALHLIDAPAAVGPGGGSAAASARDADDAELLSARRPSLAGAAAPRALATRRSPTRPSPARAAHAAASAPQPVDRARVRALDAPAPPGAGTLEPATRERSRPALADSASSPGERGSELTGGLVAGVGTGARPPGGGGRASEGGAGRPRLVASYLQVVRERVRAHREYPHLARRARLEGTICVRLSIAASGRVLEATPTCGEGLRPLVDAALASVARAAPFPPLPAALGRRLTVELPMSFELEAP